MALADYVAPLESGTPDYIGAFALTTGHGEEERLAIFKRSQDDYSAILLQSLADRLAEAFAERLHERVRRERLTALIQAADQPAAVAAEPFEDERAGEQEGGEDDEPRLVAHFADRCKGTGLILHGDNPVNTLVA